MLENPQHIDDSRPLYACSFFLVREFCQGSSATVLAIHCADYRNQTSLFPFWPL